MNKKFHFILKKKLYEVPSAIEVDMDNVISAQMESTPNPGGDGDLDDEPESDMGTHSLSDDNMKTVFD